MPRIIASALELEAYPVYGNEMIAAFLQKKMGEIKGNSLYKEYRNALLDYKEGKVKTGTVSDLFNSIK